MHKLLTTFADSGSDPNLVTAGVKDYKSEVSLPKQEGQALPKARI